MKHKTNSKNTYIVITLLVFTGVVKKLPTLPREGVEKLWVTNWFPALLFELVLGGCF